MIAIAERLGAGALATGHYARLADDGAGVLLTAAADPAKDQTYMLAGAAPRRRSSACASRSATSTSPGSASWPARAGLPVADKAESQDLCFLAGEGKGRLPRPSRRPRRPRGRDHRCRRHGPRIAPRPSPLHGRAAQGHRPGLAGPALRACHGRPLQPRGRRPCRAAADEPGGDPRRRPAPPGARVGAVRLRYRSRPLACRVEAGEGIVAGRHERLALELDAPARAGAPGQTAVLCDGDLVVGHGTIA